MSDNNETRTSISKAHTLDPDVYTFIEAQAHKRGVSPETLVNLWLAERQPRVLAGGV